VQPDLDVTGTFKMVKGDLRKEAYDLSQVSDPIYVMKPKSDRYELLDAQYAAELAAGNSGF
jgi:citronellyl-CoA synthetase